MESCIENNILVSVCCITYNHEPYIRQCLEGFMMQKTTFPFEVLIHDDASTDETAGIIREYEVKYPNIIKPIYQKENQYSKGIRISPAFQYPRAKGKYIALCEGDDYWIDPYKLQKQVDFLEKHPGYSMCFHKARVINSQGNVVGGLYEDLEEKDYSSNEILQNWIVPTASVLFKKEYTNKIPSSANYLFGDIVLFLTMAECGKVHCIDEIMSVYRRLDTGMVNVKLNKDKQSPELIRLQINHYRQIEIDFKNVNKDVIERLVASCYLSACRYFFLQRRWNMLLAWLKECWSECGVRNTFLQFVKMLSRKFCR